MADKRLNDLSTATDGAYIYAEDASGNQIKIAKADLATVVAGLLGGPLATKYTPNISDFNDFVGNGIYRAQFSFDNSPISDNTTSGLLLVFVNNAGQIIQISFRYTDPLSVYIRMRSSSNIWTSWRTL